MEWLSNWIRNDERHARNRRRPIPHLVRRRVLPLDGAAARLIAESDGAACPFWSPDNKSVALFAGGKLLRVDLAGRSPLAICDVALPRGGSWSGDGRIVYAASSDGLFQVSASGGTPSPLPALDAAGGEGVPGWPQALPDGRFRTACSTGPHGSLRPPANRQFPSGAALTDDASCHSSSKVLRDRSFPTLGSGSPPTREQGMVPPHAPLCASHARWPLG